MYYHPTVLHELIRVEEIYTIHYFEYYKDYTFNGEQHDFWELLYVDKGQLLVTAGERELCLQQGQIIFHQPNEFHNVAANGTIAPNTIVVSFSCHSPAIQALCGKICYVNRQERNLLASIISEARTVFATDLGNPEYRKLEFLDEVALGAEQMIQLYLETLLISFIRKNQLYDPSEAAQTTAQQNTEAYYFDRACQFIENNIDSSFTLDRLSQWTMVSASYLERLFRRNAKMSVIQYCNFRKIERAKQFIREDHMNISQIAEALGFSSIHYFSRVFRQWEGMSPGQYGRSVKSMEDHSDKVSSFSERSRTRRPAKQ